MDERKMQILKLGMKSHEIAKYQGILGLEADGIFGKITEQHVRGFQRENGLQQDGRIGPLTAAALEKAGKVDYVATEKTPIGQFQLSERSRQRLQGVHADLVRVVERACAISDLDFMVTEGLRTAAQQAKYVAAGRSQTKNSRHLTGHAVDLAVMIGGELTWEWKYYAKLGDIMKQAAKDVGVKIEWGGDWRTLRDGPHFQLPWASYK